MNELKLSIKVTADGKQLVTVMGDGERSANNLSNALNSTGKSGKAASTGIDTAATSSLKATTQFDGLHKAVLAALGGLSAMALVDKADAWGQMASRVKMATTSVAEYDYVQSRMVASANETYRSINETRESFISMSPILRDLGYGLGQSIDIVDSFSALLVINAASSDKASQAQDALSKSIQSGRIEADAWQSMFGVMPSLLNNLTAVTGKTGSEIRQLGVSGKLSISDLTNALLLSHSQNIEAVKEMPTTVRDALMAINNVWDDYLGRSNEAHGVTAMMSSGLVTLAENFNTVANIGGGVLAAAITLYLTNMGKAVVTSGMATVASAAHAVQELKTAQAQEAQAAITLAQTRAMFGLTTSHAQVAAAEAAHAAASARLAAAQAVLTNASRAAALALGPVGLALIVGTAAASFLTMRDASHEGAQALKDMQQPVKELREEFRKLNDDQRAAQLVKWSDAAAEATKKAKASFQDLRGAIETEFTVSSMTSAYLAGMATETPVLTQYRAQLEAAMEAGKPLAPLLKEIGAASGVPESTINNWVKLAGAFADAQQQANNANKVVSDIKTNFYTLDGALDDLVSGPLFTGEAKITAPVISDPGLTKSAQEMINKLNEQTTLFGAATESAKVFYQLQAGALVGLDPLMAEKLIKAAADLDAQKAAEEQTKKNKAAEDKRAETLKTLLGHIDPVTTAAKQYAEQEQLLKTYFEQTNTPLAERTRLLAALKNQYEQSTPYSQLRNQLDPSYAEGQAHNTNIDVLNNELAATPENDVSKRAEINALIEAEQQRHADKMNEINSGVSINWNQMWQDSLDRMTSGIGEATADALFESKNFGEGVKETIRGTAKALVQMSIEWGARKLVMAALDRSIATTSAATNVATAAATGTSMAAAYAPAAAMASLASFGGNSIPAMVGITATTMLAESLSILGIAHDGLPINRNEGTYLLRQDEMVLNPKQRDNFEYLVDYAKNGNNGGANQVNLTVSPTIVVSSESQVSDVQELLPEIVKATKIAVAEDFANRGMIWRAAN
ncbi:tape measure protein [Shewanella avicenniae]|uniref:Tape measure protein n=1 Tax=Shewanella avicenniae TaxID=2814294 RepID=A0ABX7QP15_9GAMM|nr:tape measure protein [Shewanella avicenniae]QSX32625.1 tape measure protein [Shewanella avicenniae]